LRFSIKERSIAQIVVYFKVTFIDQISTNSSIFRTNPLHQVTVSAQVSSINSSISFPALEGLILLLMAC